MIVRSLGYGFLEVCGDLFWYYPLLIFIFMMAGWFIVIERAGKQAGWLVRDTRSELWDIKIYSAYQSSLTFVVSNCAGS
jgi:hypothetical protein